MANFSFRQGFTYVAGFDKPFVAPLSAIKSGVEDEGFRVLAADECKNMRGFPFRVPSRCGDTWDWYAMVERVGPSRMIDVPGEVKWIVEIPKLQAPPPGVPTPSPAVPPTWENPNPAPPKTSAPAVTAAGVTAKIDWRLPAAVIGGVAGVFAVRWLTR